MFILCRINLEEPMSILKDYTMSCYTLKESIKIPRSTSLKMVGEVISLFLDIITL